MHEVLLERAAERDLKALSRAVYERIVSHLQALSQNPRPAGCKKITGSRSDWRIRIGDYRVIYEIDDRAKVVKVMRIRHRREAYRSTRHFDVSGILETWKFHQERGRTGFIGASHEHEPRLLPLLVSLSSGPMSTLTLHLSPLTPYA